MICKSIGLSELNEAARGSFNENKFTDAMGKTKNKVVEIAKAFVRWLISLKDKVAAFYNKVYANIISKNAKDVLSNDKIKDKYKKYKNKIDTYISNNTLDKEHEMFDYKQWNYAYSNISFDSKNTSYDDFVKTITVKTDKLDTANLKAMMDKGDMINSLQSVYKMIMKNLNDNIKKYKEMTTDTTEYSKEDLERLINTNKETTMIVVKKFNYLISLIVKTEAIYGKAINIATKDKKDTKESKEQTTEETPKTESVFDIKFM